MGKGIGPECDSTYMDRITPSYITYTGPSMRPALMSGDLLEVAPHNYRTIWCRDAILFSCAVEKWKVAHRMVAVVHNA